MVETPNPIVRKPSLSIWTIILIAVVAGIIGAAVGGGVVYLMVQSEPTPILSQSAPVDTTRIFSVDINTTVTQSVEEVGPAVVTVLSHLPARRTFFGPPVEQTASGSGVIISADGYIVTNNHVVDGAQSLEVILADGNTLPAELIGVDRFADLAVVKVEGEMLALAGWGNSDSLKPGETVIAIGSPLGEFKNTVTVGVVSATERAIEVDSAFQLEGLIQTDAAINQGNSGGPLVNLAGEVIGINTLIVRGSGSGGTFAEGLGFAISSNTARAVTDQLISKGYVARPYLGIQWVWISPEVASRYSLPVEYGVFLSEIAPGSPAANAGLLRGDIIIAIDDQPLDPEHPFRNQLFAYEPGQTIQLELMRGEGIIEHEVTLGESPG